MDYLEKLPYNSIGKYFSNTENFTISGSSGPNILVSYSPAALTEFMREFQGRRIYRIRVSFSTDYQNPFTVQKENSQMTILDSGTVSVIYHSSDIFTNGFYILPADLGGALEFWFNVMLLRDTTVALASGQVTLGALVNVDYL